jgi:hypothetical protein
MFDRKTVYTGAISRPYKASIVLAYDADVAEDSSCKKCLMTFLCCATTRPDRSYLLVREGALEANWSVQMCCGPCATVRDFNSLSYFDQAPLGEIQGPFKCCYKGTPKIAAKKMGCMICCVPCESDDVAVIVPYEKYWCCCPNRAERTCFGFCGPLPNQPMFATQIVPQPKDVGKFVEAVWIAMENVPRKIDRV